MGRIKLMFCVSGEIESTWGEARPEKTSDKACSFPPFPSACRIHQTNLKSNINVHQRACVRPGCGDRFQKINMLAICFF